MTTTSPNAQRAMTVKEFCARYRVGRTRAWKLEKAGDILARRVGAEPRPDRNGNLIDHRRVLIDYESAERWYAGLPSNGGAA